MLSKIRYRLEILRALRPFSYGVKKFLLINFFIGLFMMGLSFIKPLFYKLFIDEVILNKQPSLMSAVIAGYLAVFVLNLLLSYAKNYCTNRLVNRVAFRAKMKIWRGFFSREFVEYDNQSVGDMKMRLEDDTACIAHYSDAQTLGYVTDYASLVISAALLFLIEWRLAIFSCVSIPLTFWLDHVIAKREALVQNKQRENDQKMSSWLYASVQGWREVKALNLQKHEERQFARYIHKFAIYFGIWINYWVARVLVVPKIKEEFLMQFSLYFFGGLLITFGHFQIGSLLAFMQYYGILSDAIKTISGADAELLSSKPQSDRMLFELGKIIKRKESCLLPNSSGSIEFRDVAFAYSEDSMDVLNNVSFSISKGERVAITGKSGAGKTTVLKLMLGMLRPTAGQVLFSEADISEISPNTLHQRFGFVMQENTLFNAPIRENLLYAKNNATNLELEEACKKAFILDFIKGLPEGMETVIGERGIKLSGGQKQRIVLARQFLRDVDVFVFDEATSALDQYSESMIQDAITNIDAEKTIIVVAHRKSSLALCDRVIAL